MSVLVGGQQRATGLSCCHTIAAHKARCSLRLHKSHHHRGVSSFSSRHQPARRPEPRCALFLGCLCVPSNAVPSFPVQPPETLLLMRQWAREEEQHLLNQCADTSDGSEHSAGGEGGSQAAQPAITRAAAGPPAYVHPMAGSETRDTEAASQYSTPRNTPFLQPAKTWGSPPKVGVAVPKVADNQLGRQLGMHQQRCTCMLVHCTAQGLLPQL